MEKIKITTNNAPFTMTLPGDSDFFTQEAYKILRTNLLFCGKDVKVIALTSCNENEGKSTVAMHIGKSFSELGKNVLIIDADMRKSVIAGRNTNVLNPQGLSEILSGLCSFEDCIYQNDNSSLYMVFSGHYPPNSVELLSSKYFSALIDKCRDLFDYIIIDTPPLGLVVDAAVIAPHCDGMMLVVGAKKVPYKQARDVIEQIKRSGCRILGAVRNNIHRHEESKYRRRYYRQD